MFACEWQTVLTRGGLLLLAVGFSAAVLSGFAESAGTSASTTPCQPSHDHQKPLLALAPGQLA
eukprot:scaffold297435_cov36-Prasinocladus_malaysianus.AAC.1